VTAAGAMAATVKVVVAIVEAVGEEAATAIAADEVNDRRAPTVAATSLATPHPKHAATKRRWATIATKWSIARIAKSENSPTNDRRWMEKPAVNRAATKRIDRAAVVVAAADVAARASVARKVVQAANRVRRARRAMPKRLRAAALMKTKTMKTSKWSTPECRCASATCVISTPPMPTMTTTTMAKRRKISITRIKGSRPGKMRSA
jgi:hypothetical protein